MKINVSLKFEEITLFPTRNRIHLKITQKTFALHKNVQCDDSNDSFIRNFEFVSEPNEA